MANEDYGEEKQMGANSDEQLIEEIIPAVDPGDLRSDFDHWPELASRSWGSSKPHPLKKFPKSIVVSGLGGSGIIGELIFDLFSESRSKRIIHVLKDYHLPSHIDQSSVVIGVSCSGNTEETLSTLYEAIGRGIECHAFGTGGELEKISQFASNYYFTRAEAFKVPRSSLPGIFYPVLKFLVSNSLIEIQSDEIEESLRALSIVQKNCVDLKNSKSLGMARMLTRSKSFPLIYTSRRTRAAGMRFRQSLNENAKLHGFDGVVPELCHNDIVGWDARISKRNPQGSSPDSDDPSRGGSNPVFLLRFPDDPLEISTRMDIVSDIVRKNGGIVVEAPHEGKSYLARTMSMIYYLDFCSYYCAIFRRVNPISTPSIDFLKAELKSRLGYLEKIPERKTNLIS